MNSISQIYLRGNNLLNLKNKGTPCNKIYNNSQGDTFERTSINFKGKISSHTTQKAAKGVLLSLAAILGINLALGKTKEMPSKQAEMISNTSTKVEINSDLSFRDFSMAEIQGIQKWENENGKCHDLREILKRKETSVSSDDLQKEEDVIYLAQKLQSNPDLVEKMMTPYTSEASELVEILRLEELGRYGFEEIRSYAPNLTASEIKEVMEIFRKGDIKTNRCLRRYNELKQLKYEMTILQGKKEKEKELLGKFCEYKRISPDNIKEKLENISILEADLTTLPMMSVEDLIADIKYKHSPEARAAVIESKFNTSIKPFDHRVLLYGKKV